MSCDVANLVNADVWYRLGFLSQADLAAADWLTLDELYQFCDDAAQCLARNTSLYLTYDDSIDVVAGTPTYALPTGSIYIEGGWLVYAGGALQLLRLTSTGQLFALDAVWGTKTGPPKRLSLDAADARTATLYPNPTANSTLNLILEQAPAAVTAANTALPLSPVLELYFSDAIVAGALGKESDNARPEVAAHLVQRQQMLDAVIQSLWGSGR
jgi:hypothetical protein